MNPNSRKPIVQKDNFKSGAFSKFQNLKFKNFVVRPSGAFYVSDAAQKG